MRFLDDLVDDDVHEVGHVDVHRSGDVAEESARVDFIPLFRVLRANHVAMLGEFVEDGFHAGLAQVFVVVLLSIGCSFGVDFRL